MTELKQLIAGLVRGEQSFETVSRALDRWIACSPGDAADAARLLRAARDSGLPHHLFVALNGQLGSAIRAAANPDATVFAGDGPDATLFASQGGDATERMDHGGAPAGNGVAADATLFAEDRDSTLMNTPATGPGQERTALLGRGEKPSRTAHELFDLMSGAIASRADVSGDETSMEDALASDSTRMEDTGSDDFDILSDDAMETAEKSASSRTDASWPTAPPPQPTGPRAGIEREFQEGDLLRGRFELISKLGEGGMGAVWKGKDRLKEEARDRNPFVAIKLLQGDFKAHPEAFIALQRETAKQQRLAHPNIATVYDFDRDDATSTVFMTMEVLEGQPLDAFIRKLPADGLPEEEAMPLIEALCNGLAYAHQAGLVHSDLKPGNCFLTKDGGIKLLDFGIARASKTKTDAEGETTLFDPGQLGALTPTYATIEMFEGEDPDPRDDIYALAIMAYQLLTGRHPYGKKSAPKAQELGLVPEPVPRLSKRQNRGLARGLAYLREDRTESVEEFLDSIQRKKSRTALWVGSGLAAAIVLGVLASGPIKAALDKREREEVIAQIEQAPDRLGGVLEQAGGLGEEQLARVLDDPRVINATAGFIAGRDGANVQQGLALLASYPPDWQGKVKEVDAARQAIFGHFERRIAAAFAPVEQRYDYPKAIQELARLDALYPDSAQVFQIRGTLEDIKNETLADLGDRYKELLAAGKLIPSKQEEDISDVLGVVRQIDSQHSLLDDKTLPFRFVEETEKAIKQDQDYPRANALLAASTAYAPDDSKLKGLRYDLERILTRIENEKRIAELERRLSEAEPRLRSLSDYQGIRDELVALADLNPRNAVLERIQTRLKSAFREAFSRLVAAGQWQMTEDLLSSFARLLSIEDVTRQRLALSKAEELAGFRPDLASRKPQVEERVAAVQALLDKPTFTVDWETRLKVPYKELIALQPLGSPDLEKVRTDTARLLLSAAREARSQENFNQAREFVAKGLEFYPGLRNFADETAAIDRAEQDFLAKRAEEERLARIETLKAEFAERAAGNDVQGAIATAQAMRELDMPADDPFLTTTAPQRLADAYARLATNAASNDNYLSAIELAREGLKLSPNLQALATSLQAYEAEFKKREREIRLMALLDTLEPLDVGQVQQSMAALKADFPDRFDDMVTRFSGARANQLRKYARARDVDIATLAARTSEFATLFPRAGAALAEELADQLEPALARMSVDSPDQLAGLAPRLAAYRTLAPGRHAALSDQLASKALAAIRATETRDKSAAAALARAAKAAFPSHRQLAAVNIVVPLKEITAGLALLQRGQLAAAAQRLAAAKARDAAHPDVSPFETQLGARREQADQAYAEHVAMAESFEGYKRKAEVQALYDRARGLCSDCPYKEIEPNRPPAGLCHPGLAGFGGQRAGECWDQLGRDKGPLMVVVPAGGGSNAPFAIGKYEVSQRDLNIFCKGTNKCKVVPGSKSRLPATDVSAQLAEEYAAWLSAQASKTLKTKVVYRLPTSAEWEHAANANGAQPEKKFNCTVTSGGSKIAGFDLLDARSGQANGWGLANYVGNAQELVRAGGGLAVRGGDFEVPLTRCDPSLTKPHSGAADATTGFRLVRELG